MATKKQKHAAALARREAFLENERELGRKAIEAARKVREAEAKKAWEKSHKKHYKFEDDCPHCEQIKKDKAEEARTRAIKKVAEAAAVLRNISLDQPFSNKVSA